MAGYWSHRAFWPAPRRPAALLALSAALFGSVEILSLLPAGAAAAAAAGRAAGAQASAAGPAALAPPTGSAGAASTAEAPAPDSLEALKATYERARQLYQDSCGDRAYGAYDDICEALGKEVRRAELEYDAQKHRRDK